MSKFSQDILEVAGDEVIEAIVIGNMGWGDYNSEGKPNYQEIIGKVLSWQEALQYLDYEYNDGFGAPDCHAVTAWTANKVIFVWQYDGSTGVTSVPRNPIAHMPEMPGG